MAEYLETLRGDFVTSDNESGCAILTPFIRPDGDSIEVLAERRDDGRVILSDGGETFAYLYLSGLSLSRKLQDDARRISERYGVDIDINELVAEISSKGQVGEVFHGLVQAILNVSALIEKRRPYINLKFEEEVEGTIIGQGKRYDPDYTIRGVTGNHTVKFHVDSGLHLLIQPLSQSNELQATHTAQRWYYHFDDIKNVDDRWSCIAVLDDRGERASVWTDHARAPIEAVATVIPWSRRERLVDALEGLDSLQL
ncbi:MAG: DUF1828 domain-containing protein [Chloroflexi bacterium]|nr:DUF1828 domain-containing protein [Chloroflexota bacterium]